MSKQFIGGTILINIQSAYIMCLYPNYVFCSMARFNQGKG